MIDGNCFTNMDEYKTEYWPEQFVAVPKIGDRVMARSGKELRVCGITHCGRRYDGATFSNPYIRVELYKGKYLDLRKEE